MPISQHAAISAAPCALGPGALSTQMEVDSKHTQWARPTNLVHAEGMNVYFP